MSDALFEVSAERAPYAMVPYWMLDASATALRLYVLLLRYADNTTRVAWPSRKTLAADLGYSRAASVDPLIAELEGMGAIDVIRRKTDNGLNEANRYHVRLVRETVPVRETVLVRSRRKSGTENLQGVVPKTVPNLEPMNYNQELEPTTPLPGLESVPPEKVKKADPLEGFEEFWALWPKKVSKADARKAWPKAVKLASGTERIMDGAQRMKSMVDQKLKEPQFLKDPHRWLNGRNWEDHEVPVPAASAFPDRHLPPSFDHSRQRVAITQLTNDEIAVLSDRGRELGRSPFELFTEDEAAAMVAQRGPRND